MSWPQQRTSRSTDASEKWRHCEGRSTARRGRRETTATKPASLSRWQPRTWLGLGIGLGLGLALGLGLGLVAAAHLEDA